MQRVTGLVDAGEYIHGQDEFGKTPLHYAAEFGHNGVLTVLIKKGVDVNVIDAKGYTDLWYAEANGHDETATLLKRVTQP